MRSYIIRHIGCCNILRRESCNLHCNISHRFSDFIVDDRGLGIDNDADAAAAVYIGGDESVLFLDLLKAADRELLADDCDHFNESIVDSLIRLIFPLLSEECIHVLCIAVKSLLCDLVNIGAELLILSDEIRLGVDFDDGCLVIAVLCNPCKTFCRDAVSLLGCLHRTVLTEILNGCIDIAVCLGERLLAVHHAGAADFSELLYKCCCYCCHNC